MREKQIILCQPDDEKGCSICCGLFNHTDISKESLTAFLMKNKNYDKDSFDEKIINNVNVTDYNNKDVRDFTSYICFSQGFINTKKPGCLLHPAINTSDFRDKSFFGKKICDMFLCPAHKILSEQQKEILINSIDNWYLYSIAIIDPESFIWILEYIINLKISSSEFLLDLSTALEMALAVHAKYLCTYKGPIFFYSIPEYELEKNKFSLSSNSESIIKERNEIKKLFR